MKSICFLSNGYPTKDNPEYAFIEPLVHEIADHEVECSVIVPQSITKILLRQKKKRPYKWVDRNTNGHRITIYQPLYLSLSNLRIKGFNVSTVLKDFTVKRVVKKEKISPDAFYGHFWECGLSAAKICGEVPVFVACGESDIWINDRYPEKTINSLLPNIKGVICVSSKNMEECKELGLLKCNPKTIVLPNGFNENEFYKIPQLTAREILGIDINDTVLIFVGAFIERKGILRVVEAARKNPSVKLILIGHGDQDPISDQIIFKGRVAHDEICTYLNAADIFVLPTLAEGCCNAIIEALACGLPVISSNRKFNYDILDHECAILINPNSIEELSSAITLLDNDTKKRNTMSVKALDKSSNFTITERAKQIVTFIFSNQ